MSDKASQIIGNPTVCLTGCAGQYQIKPDGWILITKGQQRGRFYVSKSWQDGTDGANAGRYISIYVFPKMNLLHAIYSQAF